MRMCLTITILCVCTLVSSCIVQPNAEITCLVDSRITVSSEAITVVTNLEKKYNKEFQTAFYSNFQELAGTSKPIEFMQYIEFIRSDYNKPDVNDAFPNRLFVFITVGNFNAEGGLSKMGYNILLEVKHLNQNPFLVQNVFFDAGRPYSMDLDKRGGEELARVIVEELKNRKLI
jgi:hypothetical protein